MAFPTLLCNVYLSVSLIGLPMPGEKEPDLTVYVCLILNSGWHIVSAQYKFVIDLPSKVKICILKGSLKLPADEQSSPGEEIRK